MYPSIRSTQSAVRTLPSEGLPHDTGHGVGRNVKLIGVTSMVTDISSEMITAILPLYLVFQLRLTPFQFGLFNGVYFAIAGLFTIIGGIIADRTTRYKEVAGAGYGLSAACKIGLLAAQNSPIPATSALFADRVGKGMRSAPRDALISLSAPPDRLAGAFGVHRAFDTAGALLGPIVAFLVLEAAPRAYDAVFVISFLFAMIGLGVLVLFVQNRKPSHFGASTASFKEAFSLFREPEFRALTIMGAVLGLFTVGDALIYLTFQNQADFLSRFFPLLYVGTALSYLLLAVPLGRLADRVGRARVFVAGYLLLLVVYGLLLAPGAGTVELLLMLAFLGAFYACTDGVFSAMTSKVVSDEVRTSGIAVARTSAALTGFVSSLVFGLLWQTQGSHETVELFAVGLGCAVVAALFVLRVRTKRYG
jgi:MFS family permease